MTVWGETNSRAPIARLVKPSATARSLFVRLSQPVRGRARDPRLPRLAPTPRSAAVGAADVPGGPDRLVVVERLGQHHARIGAPAELSEHGAGVLACPGDFEHAATTPGELDCPDRCEYRF